jgi:hypothetical protein
VIAVLVIFGTGMTVGEMLDWGYFELSRRISVIESLTLFATVGCAIYITKILEKDVASDRIEKELHLEEISELGALLRSIETLFEDSCISYRQIEGRILSCDGRAGVILRSFQETFGGSSPVDMSDLAGQVSEGVIHLRSLLTLTARRRSDHSDLYIERGQVTYSDDRMNEIHATIHSVVGLLFRLKICINHL